MGMSGKHENRQYEKAKRSKISREIGTENCEKISVKSAEEVNGQVMVPDHHTLNYWIDRLRPLFGPQGAQSEAFVVCANRGGEEGVAPKIGEVRYAGSSCVMGMAKDGQVRLWDVLGRGQEGVLVVDTDEAPSYSITLKQVTEPMDIATNDADDIPAV